MNKPLILRLREAEEEVVAALMEIGNRHELPCFLFEPIIDKVHKQIIAGVNKEYEQALAQQALAQQALAEQEKKGADPE